MFPYRYRMFFLLLGLVAVASASLVFFAGSNAGVLPQAKTTAVYDLSAAVQKALASGEHALKIPPGRYILPRQGARLEKLRDFVIDGTGVTLVATSFDMPALTLEDDHNLTLKGFTLDYDPLPFTQGTITAKDPKNGWFAFTIQPGYPRLSPTYLAYAGVYIYDKATHRIRPSVPDLYPRRVDILAPDQGRLVFGKYFPGMETTAVGDSVVLVVRSSHGVRIARGTDGLRFEDITILSAPGVAIRARGAGANNFFRYKVKSGPKPPGATTERLMSTSADGFNYADSRFGPTLDGCDFSAQGDDDVNLHGPTFAIVGKEGPNTLWIAMSHTGSIAPLVRTGDTLRVMQFANGKVKVLESIQRFSAAKNPALIETALRILKPFSIRVSRDTVTFFKVVLNKPHPEIAVGDICDVPQINSPNFLIQNSRFTDHRARGVRVSASNGIIRNNTFARINNSAIILGPEYGRPGEAGWVSNVQITGNTIEASNLKSNGADGEIFCGAISTFGRLSVKGPNAEYTSGNADLVIRGNTIRNISVDGIHLNLARNVLVENNQLQNVNSNPKSLCGEGYGLKLGQGIGVDHSTGVTLRNNVIH